MKFLKPKASLAAVSAVLSLFTLAAFHIPFFRHVIANVESGFNAVLIFISMVVIMVAANYFFYYLLLWTGRFAGKLIVAFSFVADAVSLYFINTYDVILDESMMGNVFNTQFSEASGFFSFGAVLYVLFLGVIPCVYIFVRKTDYGSFKRFAANTGASLGLIIVIVFANMTNWPWMDRNSTILGSLLMPWSYTVNTVRHELKVRERNREEIKLPDAEFRTNTKDVCVLVIGESARRDHFSLYGYGRETNPKLKSDSVKVLIANSAATYTTAGVKAILDHKPTDKLYEILPNYMYRAGADVIWRTTNWGEPPVHIEKYRQAADLKKMYPDEDDRYDGILLRGLAEEILSSGKNKVLVILHTNTSHGPSYEKHYPKEFETFSPICTTVEMSKADPAQLMNSYDNSIVYTDHLLHTAIGELKSLPEEWRSCMIYVSDHGESLGEGNLYMHGVPMSIAPKEQIEIPFIVWTSEGISGIKDLEQVGQYHVFHSVMNFMGAYSEIYDEEMNIFSVPLRVE